MLHLFKMCPDCEKLYEGHSRRCCKCGRKHDDARKPIEIIVARALKQGALIRQPCEVCGAIRVDAHHDDYSKPLDIRWLCRAHHQRHHAKQNREQPLYVIHPSRQGAPP